MVTLMLVGYKITKKKGKLIFYSKITHIPNPIHIGTNSYFPSFIFQLSFYTASWSTINGHFSPSLLVLVDVRG